jgi:hypothetical protein
MKATVMILNPIKSAGTIFPLLLLLLALFLGGFRTSTAQVPPGVPTPKTVTVGPTPEKFPRPVRAPLPRRQPNAKKIVVNESETPAERSITVEPKVNLTVCITEGSVKINGWDRDEVRAFVSEGSEVGFKVAQKNVKSGKAEDVYILGFDPLKTKEIRPNECLTGTEIELDVPRGAIINLKSSESDISIESVYKVRVENGGGSIFLNDITQGVNAVNYAGSITVEKSSGSMMLTTTSGNIVAVDLSPGEVGDYFRAKTNSGIITLNTVAHRQIETNSITGSTSYSGDMLDGGRYGFNTQNGSIVLAVPEKSVCRITAWFGFGRIVPELPVENALQREQSYSGQLGTGETTCSLNLKTTSGAIRIRKQQ